MNHDAARSAIEALFKGQPKHRAELRAHLDGCLECRRYYDNTARAFRSLTGAPGEMTREELWLFEPALPEAEARFRWPVWLGGVGLLAAAALALVVFRPGGDAGFTARGGQPQAAHPGLRAFCTRAGKVVGEAGSGSCQAGDAVVFSVVPSGRKYLALVVGGGEKPEPVVSGEPGKLAAQGEVVLPNGATFAPGRTAVAVFGGAPISSELAERCLTAGSCPKELERVEVSFSGGVK